jgi:hypothetical protein
MQFRGVKPVIIGVGTAAAVIALTGAVSGSGVGGVFNLGKTNKVNATSGLTGSTKNSMLAVTNSGSGTALSLQVGKGKAPFSVNSSARVANLNASLLGGLAASQFVQGGGRYISFGLTDNPIPSIKFSNLLSVPGFGTLSAACIKSSNVFAEVNVMTGSHRLDTFITIVDSNLGIAVSNSILGPKTLSSAATASSTGTSAEWVRLTLRYATGTRHSLTTHVATVEIMVAASSTDCDFDASAIIGPGVKGP